MPDTYRIIILPEAADNLESIHTHIELDSPQNAVAVSRKLLEAVDSLELFPHRYKAHTSSKNPDRVVHSMPVPPFIIYYRVIEHNLAVEVMTIRHGARRQPRRLS